MTQQYQAIALDLDGTLLTPDKKISTATKDALNEARSRGIKVVLATGRHPMMTRHVHQELALDTPMICSNGACLSDPADNRTLIGEPLALAPLAELLDRVVAQRIDALFYLDEGIGHFGCEEWVGRIRGWSARLPEHLKISLFSAPDLREWRPEQLWKLELFHQDPLALRRFVDEAVNGLPFTQDWASPGAVELVQPGCSKGNRLAQWAASEGIAMENVVAFGDNDNDISMFEQVGLAVAMGNAAPRVQARADRVTANNDEDGIALALRRWVLPA